MFVDFFLYHIVDLTGFLNNTDFIKIKSLRN